MAWAEPAGKDRWRGRYYAKVDGARVPRTAGYATTRQKAKKLGLDEEAKVRNGSWFNVDAGRVTFSEYFELLWLPNRGGELNTKSNYRSQYNAKQYGLKVSFGDTQLRHITNSVVQGWVAKMIAAEMSASTIEARFVTLQTVLAAHKGASAVRDRLIQTNPCLGVQIPKRSKKEVEIYDPEQVETLLDHLDPWWVPIPMLDAETGMRWGELMGLKVKDFTPAIGEWISTTAGDPSPGLTFTAPTSPRTVVLDTRTRRGPTSSYDIVDGDLIPRTPRAPRLLNADARVTVRRRLVSASRSHRAVIVVAPSPVWGLEDIETALTPAGYVTPEGVDFESWSANPRSRIDLMKMAQDLRIRPLVVLSGDVHYGFAAAARSTSQGADTFYAQFCSSATKNQSGGKLAFALRIAGYELPHPGERKYVWLQDGDDGPTSTVKMDPVRMLNPLHAAEVVKNYTMNRTLLGEPDWVERRSYNAVSSALGGLISSVVIGKNNIGELWMDGEALVHRHWLLDGDQLRVLGGLRWSPGDWPA